MYKPIKDKRFFKRLKLNCGTNSTIYLLNMLALAKAKTKCLFDPISKSLSMKKCVYFQKMTPSHWTKLFFLNTFIYSYILHENFIIKDDLGGIFFCCLILKKVDESFQKRERVRSGSKDKKIDFLDTNNELI